MQETWVELINTAMNNSPLLGIIFFIVAAFAAMGKMVYNAFEKGNASHSEQIQKMFDMTNQIQKEVREDSKQREEALIKEITKMSLLMEKFSLLFGELREDVRDIKRDIS